MEQLFTQTSIHENATASIATDEIIFDSKYDRHSANASQKINTSGQDTPRLKKSVSMPELFFVSCLTLALWLILFFVLQPISLT